MLYTGGENVHYIHLNKVSKYCFVEVSLQINRLSVNMNMYIYKMQNSSIAEDELHKMAEVEV